MANKVAKLVRLRAVYVGVGTSALVLLILFGAAYGGYRYAYAAEIFPGINVASLSVAGLTPADAETLITERIRAFEATPLVLSVADQSVTITATELAVSYDAGATAESAYQVGRSGSVWDRVADQVQALAHPTEIPLVVNYSSEALTHWLDELGRRFNDPAANAGFEYRKGVLVVTPEQTGQEFDRAALEQTVQEAIATATAPPAALTFPLTVVTPSVTRSDAGLALPVTAALAAHKLILGFEEKQFVVTPEQLVSWVRLQSSARSAAASVDGFLGSSSALLIDFDRESVAAFAKTMAADIAQEPVDAKLTIKDGKATIFAAAQDGRALDEAATIEAILAALRGRRMAAQAGKPIAAEPIKLPVAVTKPTITSSTVEDLGIKELIGSATTDFKGSPDNRIHNIGTGLKYLNGWLVKPGDEFSTVKALGAVDGSTGYLPELVIKENKTIPEFGGGLCQVSTTLFRSVMNAGLPITERQNHSYRVVYYERGIGPGLDATVYLPRPDFRFKNDTPGWVLIQGSIKGNNLTFELYGSSDGRVASIDGPHTLSTTEAPPTVYESNPALAPGEQKEVGHAHPGATTTATYTVKRGGEVINQQTFLSKYKAIAAIVQQGPTANAAPAPPPESTPAEPPPADQPAQQ